ncbi:MAG: 2-isopropylmalate synthase [Candidatus Methanospirare jalkutatii]|nr:2-isopropylmalate synthase [Candidatus Methanospirare jalkutatii]
MEERRRVGVLDTTLRDGEQTPGISFTPEAKLKIAMQLDEIGVDIVEAGTAIVSEGERKAIKEIANAGLKAKVCSFARMLREDLDAALDCDVDAVNIVVPVSDAHIQKKLRIDRETLRERAIEAAEYVKKHGVEVEISAEDASRADFSFLKSLFQDLANVADRLCVCDTVGVLTPERAKEIFSELSGMGFTLSAHCHNDFGMATANSIAAVLSGAEYVHVTVNGMGERAGNAPLEEVVVALELLYGIKTGIKKEKIYETSRLVRNLAKMPVAPNKALVGDNAFTHESGMHVHGTLADERLYEPFDPKIIGRTRRFAFGKHTGKASVKMALEEMGISAENVSESHIRSIIERVKELGDKGKLVTDADFQAIVEDVLQIEREERIKLLDLSVVSGKSVQPTASLRLSVNGDEIVVADVGVGPVDAAINALRKAISGRGMNDLRLEEYHVDAITGGTDALVNVVVRVSRGDKTITASGVSEDIVLASVQAMINGINRLYRY